VSRRLILGVGRSSILPPATDIFGVPLRSVPPLYEMQESGGTGPGIVGVGGAERPRHPPFRAEDEAVAPQSTNPRAGATVVRVTVDPPKITYARHPVHAPAIYEHGPDSVRQPGVPVGRVIRLEMPHSHVYPGISRTVQLYAPAQYAPGEPAALMVFQDGQLYLDPDGDIRAGIVLDNLIARGEMPVTIGVFVDPGSPSNRNREYDASDDRYASFLLDEIIPRVREQFTITDDPDHWAICGGSSGGNCALTVAWNRPDHFRRVISFVGSFAQMPGGNPYPTLIRTTPARPLRVFLQAGSRDLNWDQPVENWYSENLLVAAALAERSYDHRLVLGDGGHSTNHGGAILPDALRWIWR